MPRKYVKMEVLTDEIFRRKAAAGETNREIAESYRLNKYQIKQEVKLKYRVIEQLRVKYSMQAMCEILKVSRSGYYAWRKRKDKESKDQWSVDLIMECQHSSRQTYGYGRVKCWLAKLKKLSVNRKAIIRIMRKYDLLSCVRRRRSYTYYMCGKYDFIACHRHHFEHINLKNGLTPFEIRSKAA